jgi:cytochrome c553
MRGRASGSRIGAWLLAAVVPSAAVVHPAAAQSAPPGRLLASNCYQCHGTNGRGPGFDTLAGKSAQSLYDELVEMRAGKEGTGLMQKHALGYTDAQLRLIADWLSKQR